MTFPYLNETKELNEIVRKEADGSFVALSDGVTHYELGGDENGIPVVLAHGFSVPYFIFDPTFDFLVENGFRVLRYDLFGRGYSDRPRADYNIQLFIRQLKDLLDALNFKRINLAGLSMGGIITTAFISEYPDYVVKQILIDPAGAERIKLPLVVNAARIPVFGELAFGLMGSGSM
ncbi:MAG: alpha/beta hydrolase, partial [Anaerolineales bacterium]|nr:alpha/beta hydrolase [Anaerolineales bacterium]